MARRTDFRIEGARELENFLLKELPAKIARTEMLKGMRQSAKPMVNLAKVKAPVRSGALQQSIGLRTVPMRGGATESQLTDLLGGSANTFAAIEIGPLSGSDGAALSAWARYKAHYGQGISIKKGNKVATGLLGRIRHGHLMEFGFTHFSGRRVEPKPFLKPAFNGAFPIYRRVLVGNTRQKIEKAIRKHNSTSRGPK